MSEFTKFPDCLRVLASDVRAPLPSHQTVFVDVRLNSYENFFKSLYAAIVSRVYRDHTSVPHDVIAECDFIFICKYILKSRLDFVYSRTTGVVVADRVAFENHICVPKSLYKMLRCIGVVTIFNEHVTVVPKAEDPPECPGDYITNTVEDAPNLIIRFSNFSSLFPNRHYTSSAPFLNESVAGTVYWLLSVRECENRSIVAHEQHQVVVVAAFPDWTEEDAILAAMVQNGLDGIFSDFDNIMYHSDDIKDALILRQRFHLEANL